MNEADPRVAARYNVRPLLQNAGDGLRDAVAQLGVPTHQLMAVARYGAVEALALQGLSSDQAIALEQAVREAGGALLTSANLERAVVLAPLMVAGELPSRLSANAEIADVGMAIGAALMGRGVPPPLRARGHLLEFGRRTLVMGIVNVTPDSFSGDGVGSDVDAAVERALALIEAGADVIDIGGESTRPNSTPISAVEEQERVLPVFAALSSRAGVPLSIDTRKAAVAAAAIEAGAAMVNDVWGLQGDPEMAPVIAARDDIGVVVMHNQRGLDYTDLMADITRWLRQSLVVAIAAGIAAERVVIDPGFGFGKTPAQNLELMRRLGELRGISRPILVGPSRKSTIGFLTGGLPPDQRVAGSIALATLAAGAGAHVVRVHDVSETVLAMKVADAVVRGTPEHILSLPAPGPTG
ncbi:MAG TPA: dihydropteroate synthase [Candidatus Acidoferrales bacterium]|nr:dihydropteroate synthase [Candidatus Acidoferrales bacterium]